MLICQPFYTCHSPTLGTVTKGNSVLSTVPKWRLCSWDVVLYKSSVKKGSRAVSSSRYSLVSCAAHWVSLMEKLDFCCICKQCGISESLAFVVGNSPMTQPYTHLTSMHEFLDGSGGLGTLNGLICMFSIWNKIFLVQEVATPFTWWWAIKVLGWLCNEKNLRNIFHVALAIWLREVQLCVWTVKR